MVRLIEIDGMVGISANLGGVGNSNDHSIEGKYIVCNDSGPIFIRYLCAHAAITEMDSLFTEALACRIALEISTEIKQSDANYQKLQQEYGGVVSLAKRADAIETPGEIIPVSDWLLARF
jgi:hypothetical protein